MADGGAPSPFQQRDRSDKQANEATRPLIAPYSIKIWGFTVVFSKTERWTADGVLLGHFSWVTYRVGRDWR
jgi:hypothetical protein